MKTLTLHHTDPAVTKAVSYLLETFIVSSNAILVTNADHLQMTQLLATEGILQPVEMNRFQLMSPLLRSFLMRTIVPTGCMKIPLVQPPVFEDGSLNVRQLMQEALNCFSQEAYIAFRRKAYKQNRAPGAPRTLLVPSENVYEVVLYTILANWLSSFTLHPCVRDFVLFDNPRPTILSDPV